MNRDEYLKMHAVEDRMWWYRGLHRNLLATLLRPPRAGRILDAGCGTGGFLKQLRQTGTAAIGLDLDPLAAVLAAEKSGAPVAVGSLNALPFAAGSFGAIVSADVLYHRQVDEAAALAGFHRCLAPGGMLVLNLPAYEWMRGEHDRAVHTARRYTAGRISRQLRDAGFSQVSTTYWNTLLFPLMVLRRKVLTAPEGASDVHELAAPVEMLFRAAMRIEGRLLRWGVRLPFGGSVLAIAVK